MPLKIVRNDITKMQVDAIVNTASSEPYVGEGCDIAVYTAAGFDELLKYRKEKIGSRPEGSVFLTPGYKLPAKHIIHAVSPLYLGGKDGEEKNLRSCYRESLSLANKMGFSSVAFPLISTGSFGYPKEEGMRIAVDEIHAFLLKEEMLVYLVVFGEETTALGRKIDPELRSYIDSHYVEARLQNEYLTTGRPQIAREMRTPYRTDSSTAAPAKGRGLFQKRKKNCLEEPVFWEEPEEKYTDEECFESAICSPPKESGARKNSEEDDFDFEFGYSYDNRALKERMKHVTDTFSEYLLYLIQSKGMTNAEVYNRAIVDKKNFSKIKNNPDYHPTKLTAMCLCIGAKLNLDEAKDLLARAGYALSPCDKRDIIFQFFIENGIYDMIELDLQLEEYDLQTLIS